jgi:hypothetical protein
MREEASLFGKGANHFGSFGRAAWMRSKKGGRRREYHERLKDDRTRKTLGEGGWVYGGSRYHSHELRLAP